MPKLAKIGGSFAKPTVHFTCGGTLPEKIVGSCGAEWLVSREDLFRTEYLDVYALASIAVFECPTCNTTARFASEDRNAASLPTHLELLQIRATRKFIQALSIYIAQNTPE